MAGNEKKRVKMGTDGWDPKDTRGVEDRKGYKKESLKKKQRGGFKEARQAQNEKYLTT